MKYIIASIEGVRHDLAPEYNGTYGKVYHYGSFDLIIYTCGDYLDNTYDIAYKEISEYVTKVNDELKNNNFYRGWMYGEMLTPNERHEYNDIRCNLFHVWLIDKIITADEIIVEKVNVNGKSLHDRIDVYKNPEQIMKICRALSSEMLKSIHEPGQYLHKMAVTNSDLYLKNFPIFELGWTLPYNIQIIDKSYCSYFKEDKDVA